MLQALGQQYLKMLKEVQHTLYFSLTEAIKTL